MSNKKITDLPELTNPTTDDVFPIVDIATNTTLKVQVGNLPVQTAVTTALATKQATLVSGTNIKTVNSTTLLGSGDIAVQDTLVSGTNIKTINGTSVLGSGDIVTPYTPPSGVSGAIQFSNGSAFASDATNLFWDDTNNRQGIGLNNPTAFLHISSVWNAGNNKWLKLTQASNGNTFGIVPAQVGFDVTGYSFQLNDINEIVGSSGKTLIGTGLTGNEMTARLGIRGTGSTSATTSLLVQNSSGTEMLSVNDAGQTTLPTLIAGIVRTGFINTQNNAFSIMQCNGTTGNAKFYQFVSIGTSSDPVASAALDVVSTTKGFLPPRGTNTQMNAIASPATGLVFYDTTNNKLCVYNATSWIPLH